MKFQLNLLVHYAIVKLTHQLPKLERNVFMATVNKHKHLTLEEHKIIEVVLSKVLLICYR
ncbi:MAG TPA: hypothetical protein DCM01_04675 [Dielma fastidiosa]|nr:hypothetical protein [Dielma fastidiosa]